MSRWSTSWKLSQSTFRVWILDASARKPFGSHRVRLSLYNEAGLTDIASLEIAIWWDSFGYDQKHPTEWLSWRIKYPWNLRRCRMKSIRSGLYTPKTQYLWGEVHRESRLGTLIVRALTRFMRDSWRLVRLTFCRTLLLLLQLSELAAG